MASLNLPTVCFVIACGDNSYPAGPSLWRAEGGYGFFGIYLPSTRRMLH